MTTSTPADNFPLAMASEGETVRVVAILGGKAMTLRVSELGLNIGSEVVVRQRQGGGLVIGRGETRFALGGGMAHKILVTRA
ncbi:FeoA family protein [Pseudothauera lacus]|uniref:Ferrous iron transport protein A n=1 Tax=Pseudothauera lacus TaxID=2136175 RepID=A0A2T4IBI9_9RHOO|nr:FeoA family protein [Pseudothauera lacus]PTD95098.1 ferrous iron transport protein A [Pseudothauera lacus]